MIKTRKTEEKPQPLGSINFLNPKKPKTFVKRLKEWAKNKGLIKTIGLPIGQIYIPLMDGSEASKRGDADIEFMSRYGLVKHKVRNFRIVE